VLLYDRRSISTSRSPIWSGQRNHSVLLYDRASRWRKGIVDESLYGPCRLTFGDEAEGLDIRVTRGGRRQTADIEGLDARVAADGSVAHEGYGPARKVSNEIDDARGIVSGEIVEEGPRPSNLSTKVSVCGCPLVTVHPPSTRYRHGRQRG
jgi:hypothetical protein